MTHTQQKAEEKCDIKNETQKCDMKKWDIQMKNVKESLTSTPKKKRKIGGGSL